MDPLCFAGFGFQCFGPCVTAARFGALWQDIIWGFVLAAGVWGLLFWVSPHPEIPEAPNPNTRSVAKGLITVLISHIATLNPKP